MMEERMRVVTAVMKDVIVVAKGIMKVVTLR